MSKEQTDVRERVSLEINTNIELTLKGSENETRKFTVQEVLGSGGTAFAYKVSFDGSDNNRYLYVLKEIYPMPTQKMDPMRRDQESLNVDNYDARYPKYYDSCKNQFIKAYSLQNDLATGEDKVTCITTSLPIGLYEDRKSSRNGNYAIYGLFQYQAGENLKKHKEKSLLEIVDIQRKIAETVKAYHSHGYLWLDIKEANVSVVGDGTVQSVSMFDFGSLISIKSLKEYDPKKDKDFVISFSPTSADLLLPYELEAMFMISDRSDFPCIKSEFKDRLNLLGKYGEAADIFLLGSMFFKRLFGKAPTKEICNEIQNGTFDYLQSRWLKKSSSLIVDFVKKILIKSLKYIDRGHRYLSADDYLTDLNEVYRKLNTNEDHKLFSDKEKNYVRSCCSQHMDEVLTGKGGKFEHLQKLRFDSRVSLLSDKSTSKTPKYVKPDSAIDSDRLVFLYGDGGMGKSTALYDYMKVATASAIYVELSRYKETEGDLKFILYTIINEICKNFRNITSAGDVKSKEVIKDELLTSFELEDTVNGQCEYILLLDGYNEISKELRVRFDAEIENIINTWHNVRIVITGRDIPKEIDGKELELYKDFRTYKFVGISDEDCTALITDKFHDRAGKIRNDEKLWEVLRIPMFMGMFLQLGADTTAVVHTRGEILDQFITQTEVKAAKVIAKGQEAPTGLRKFLILYSLPFAANDMDISRVYSSFQGTFIEKITIGNLLYLIKRVGNSRLSLYENISKNIVKKSDIPFDDERYEFRQMKIRSERKDLSFEDLEYYAMQDMISLDSIIHILIIEAGYCYNITKDEIAFVHEYYKDYFAAKHIQNILAAAEALGKAGLSREEQLEFIKNNGLNYTWSDDVCILLGEIIGDYKNEPVYKEE